MGARAVHDRIRRGALMLVRTCKTCGGAYSHNVTYEDDGQCCACDYRDLQTSPGAQSMNRVQVYGPPEECALEADERLCTDGDAERAVVVFHPGAIELTGGGWSCASCAFSTQEKP